MLTNTRDVGGHRNGISSGTVVAMESGAQLRCGRKMARSVNVAP